MPAGKCTKHFIEERSKKKLRVKVWWSLQSALSNETPLTPLPFPPSHRVFQLFEWNRQRRSIEHAIATRSCTRSCLVAELAGDPNGDMQNRARAYDDKDDDRGSERGSRRDCPINANEYERVWRCCPVRLLVLYVLYETDWGDFFFWAPE